MRTTTVDAYCSYTGDACLHGVISVTISGLSLNAANVHTLQACAFGQDTELAAATAAVAAGTATCDLTLESPTLIAMLGARREIDAQLFLWDATAVVPAWNGPIKIRWAPEPTGYVATTPGTPAIDAAAATALVTAHNAATGRHTAQFAAKEDALGNPAVSGQALVSTDAGVRSWSTVASLSDTTPQALGTAAAGNGTTASRHNHVHTLPKLDDAASPDDNTDLDASTTLHGLAPKATAPAAGLLSVLGIGNGETARTDKAIFDTSNPAANGTAAPGTALVAARRDHVHATDITRYRAQTVAAPANAGGAVTLAFATDLILQLTLTSNWTSSVEPTGLADGETAAAFVTLSGFTVYAAPADTATAKYGPWTVDGLIVRVGVQRVGTVYYWTAVSF